MSCDVVCDVSPGGQTTLPPPTASCQDTIYTEISAFPHTPYTPPLINDDDHFTVNITMYLVDLLDLVELQLLIETDLVLRHNMLYCVFKYM